jgi:hypothetical protein
MGALADRHGVVGMPNAAQARCASSLRSAGQSCRGAALDDTSLRDGASLRSTRDYARLEHALPLPSVLHLRAFSLPPFASRCSGMMSPAFPRCCGMAVEELHRACWAGLLCVPDAALELLLAVLGRRTIARERLAACRDHL